MPNPNQNPNDTLLKMFGRQGYPALFDKEYEPTWESAGPQFAAIPSSVEGRIAQCLSFAELLSKHGVKLVKTPFKFYSVKKFDPKRIFAEQIFLLYISGCEDFLDRITRQRLLESFDIETSYSFFDYSGSGAQLYYNLILKPRKNITADQGLAQYEGTLYYGQLPIQLRERWMRGNPNKSALIDAKSSSRNPSNSGRLPLDTKTVNAGISSMFISRCAKDRLVLRLMYAPQFEFPSWVQSRGKKKQACEATFRRVLKSL